MGCDIHLYREKLVDGVWVSADNWKYDDDYPYVDWKESAYSGRNYVLFGILSDRVRGNSYSYSFEPRGIPENSCQEIKDVVQTWDCDGHSHSHIYLSELKNLRDRLDKEYVNISGMMDKNQLALLKESINSNEPDWDLIYPYCGWGNSPNLVDFSIDVPVSFYIGDDIDCIINSFDGMDGDDHRIVFFFDN